MLLYHRVRIAFPLLPNNSPSPQQVCSASAKGKSGTRCYSGQDRIRTYEDVVSGFTVRPIWPLWNLPR